MTNQPQWELVYATDYSAFYRDVTDVYEAELVIAQTDDDVDEDDIEATSAYVYRFSVDRCWQVTRDGATFLCSQNPARESELPYPLSTYVPWFAKSLGDVARSVGSTVEDLTEALCCEDPGTRAEVYEAIGGYHGFMNLDHEPSEWTAHEFAQWPERGPKLDSDERDAFTRGYIGCALWCGVMAYKHDDSCEYDESDADTCTCEPELTSDHGGHVDESDIDEDTLASLTSDAHDFYASNVADLRASALSMDRAGHDFWLTRNRHGAGFWDEGYRQPVEANAALARLTATSHAYGSMDLIVGDDGKVSVM